MDLLQQRAEITQEVIDLTTGRDTAQIAENIKELRRMVQQIKQKQPADGMSVRRYENRFYHTIKQ